MRQTFCATAALAIRLSLASAGAALADGPCHVDKGGKACGDSWIPKDKVCHK